MRRPIPPPEYPHCHANRWRAIACLLALLACTAYAQDPTLATAEAMIRNDEYQAAYDLLTPLAPARSGDATFFYLLGRAALGRQDAEGARIALERSIDLDPDRTDAHLALGRAYLALGQEARARNQFAIVLHFGNLPPDMLSQLEIYDDAAGEELEGRNLTAFGYAETGLGRYRVNSTRGTNAFGDGDRRDTFYNLRAGGGLNRSFERGYALDATIDYRHRWYDNPDSRDDRDLRWSVSGSHGSDDGNLALGLRGRTSYRGNDDYRNDISGFVDYVRNLDLSNQLSLELAVERRRYPRGPLRERSRTRSTVTGGWLRSFADGNASFSFNAHFGRNTATSRPDGDSEVYGITMSLDYVLGRTVDAFAFAFWERDDFSADNLHFHPDVDEGVVLRRSDNLYEGGAGLVWEFAQRWSLRPELLYIRDQSNVVGLNYSSTEAWINVRRSF
jgi:tetratricopeptide (TPR) repeat protein